MNKQKHRGDLSFAAVQQELKSYFSGASWIWFCRCVRQDFGTSLSDLSLHAAHPRTNFTNDRHNLGFRDLYLVRIFSRSGQFGWRDEQDRLEAEILDQAMMFPHGYDRRESRDFRCVADKLPSGEISFTLCIRDVFSNAALRRKFGGNIPGLLIRAPAGEEEHKKLRQIMQDAERNRRLVIPVIPDMPH